MSDRRLEQLVAEVDALRQRLESEDLSADDATRMLEQITQLAQDAMAALEAQNEALDSRERGP
ncbi:MAG: hypothetical protein ACXVYV_10045 [Gaiellales bacterium]